MTTATTFCTDCDYCGKIRTCQGDGYGGKVCSDCRKRLIDACDRVANQTTLVAVEVTRDHNDDGELKWLVTPTYRRPDGTLLTVPDSRGWDTAAEAFADADATRDNAKARGIWASREQA